MSVPYGVIRTAVRILYEGERNPMETKVKHREWVKTAAIIFLTVLLILTFFSLLSKISLIALRAKVEISLSKLRTPASLV